MALQQTYPLATSIDDSTYATGFHVNTDGSLTTLKIPAQFLYGAKWYNGNGNPVPSIGHIGDYYINLVDGGVWARGQNDWGQAAVFAIKGLQGDKGVAGSTLFLIHGAPSSTIGQVGDTAINGDTGDIYYRIDPTTWGPVFGNLRGPKGDVGQAGPKGDVGPAGPAGTGLHNRGYWVANTVYGPGDYTFDIAASGSTTNNMWIFQGATTYSSALHPYADTAHWIPFAAPAGPAGTNGTNGTNGVDGAPGPANLKIFLNYTNVVLPAYEALILVTQDETNQTLPTLYSWDQVTLKRISSGAAAVAGASAAIQTISGATLMSIGGATITPIGA
jgi:hypothetical protein